MAINSTAKREEFMNIIDDLWHDSNCVGPVWMRRSADEQWVDVFWENTLPPRVQQGTNTEFYTVTLKEVSSQAHTPSAPGMWCTGVGLGYS